MPLALALVSHHANSIINGTTASLRFRQLKWSATWYFHHVMPLTSILASHDATGIGVAVMCYHCISVSIMWSGQHHLWNHSVPEVKIFKMRCNITIFVRWHHGHQPWYHVILIVLSMAPLYFLYQDNLNEVQHDFVVIWSHLYWHQCHMLPTASSKAPLHSLC